MGPPTVPKLCQNFSQISSKIITKSMWFFVTFLDHFGRHFGSQNGVNFVTFSRLFKKSQKFVDMWFLTTVPRFSSTFEGPRASNFKKNESRGPFGMFFLTWFLDQLLSCFWCNFGAFWEPKSSKNDAQKSHVKRDDFHVTLWALWGDRPPAQGGLLPARIVPSSRVSYWQ